MRGRGCHRWRAIVPRRAPIVTRQGRDSINKTHRANIALRWGNRRTARLERMTSGEGWLYRGRVGSTRDGDRRRASAVKVFDKTAIAGRGVLVTDFLRCDDFLSDV